MKFVLPKEMIPELLSGKIDENGFFEDHIEFKHHGKDCHISLRPTNAYQEYDFIEHGIHCDIEFSVFTNSIYITIYVSEYTFRRILMGKISLEEVLRKQRAYSTAGPFRVDEEYKLVIE